MSTQKLLAQSAHRPIALRDDGPIGHQTWADLLFAHWRVPAEALGALLPAGLTLDLHADYPDEAWVGIVPFAMKGVRPRGLPSVWGLSSFLELNVRTYVRCQGVPGVYFISLDAASWLGVFIAKYIFHLPYYWAHMTSVKQSASPERFAYTSERRGHSVSAANFEATYGPTGAASTAESGSLLEWLTERYCVFSADSRGSIWRADIHHKPWQLHPAEVSLIKNDLTICGGVDLKGPPVLVHFSKYIDVLVWLPKRVKPGLLAYEQGNEKR